jgi:hypothetical protein
MINQVASVAISSAQRFLDWATTPKVWKILFASLVITGIGLARELKTIPFIAVCIRKTTLFAYRFFKWGPPQISKDGIPKIPQSIVIYDNAPFKAELFRAKDLKGIITIVTPYNCPF